MESIMGRGEDELRICKTINAMNQKVKESLT